MDFYRDRSLKQQSLPIGLIILIVSQAVFALIPLIRCVLRGEAANTNFIVYGLTRRTHDPPHSRRARQPLHHRCDFCPSNFGCWPPQDFVNIVKLRLPNIFSVQYLHPGLEIRSRNYSGSCISKSNLNEITLWYTMYIFKLFLYPRLTISRSVIG